MAEYQTNTQNVDKIIERASDLTKATDKLEKALDALKTASGKASPEVSKIQGLLDKLSLSAGDLKGKPDTIFELGKSLLNLTGIDLSQTSKSIADVGQAAEESAGFFDAFGGAEGIFEEIFTSITTGKIDVLGLAAKAIQGIGNEIQKAKEKVKKANIEKRFGDITLSIDDMRTAAEQMMKSNALDQVGDSIKRLGDLNNQKQQIDSVADSVNRLLMNGIATGKLDENDSKLLGDNINQLIEGSKKYLKDTKVAFQVEAYTYMPKSGNNAVLNTGLTNFAEATFGDLQSQFDEYSKNVQELYEAAMKDGIVDADESKAIQEAVKKMQGALDKISEAEYNIKKGSIGKDILKLDAESFSGVLKEAQTLMEETLAGIEDTKIKLKVPFSPELAPELDDRVRQYVYNYIDKQFNEKELTITMDKVNVALGTLKAHYQIQFDDAASAIDKITSADNEIGKNLKLASKNFNLYWDEFTSASPRQGLVDSYKQSLGSTVDIMLTNVLHACTNLSKEFSNLDVPELEGFLKQMEPDEKQLLNLQQKYREMGVQVPKQISDGLSDMNQLKAMTGKGEAIYFMLGEELANNEDFLKVLTTVEGEGAKLPEHLRAGIENNSNLVYDAATGMFNEVNKSAESDAMVEMLAFINSTGGDLSKMFSDSMAEQLGLVYDSSTNMWKSVDQGVLDSMEGTMLIVKDSASGVVTGLKDSITGKVTELSPEMVELLKQLGFDMSQGFVDLMSGNLTDNHELVRNSAGDMIIKLREGSEEKLITITPELQAAMKSLGINMFDSMNDQIDGVKLGAPSPTPPGWKSIVGNSVFDAQNYLDKNPLSYKGNVSSINFPNTASVSFSGRFALRDPYTVFPRFAAGGVFTHSQIIEIGEAGPEVVVPLSDNAPWIEGLSQSVSRRITAPRSDGAQNSEYLSSVVNMAADRIVGAIAKNGDVVVDVGLDGKSIVQYVKKEQARQSRREQTVASSI